MSGYNYGPVGQQAAYEAPYYGYASTEQFQAEPTTSPYDQQLAHQAYEQPYDPAPTDHAAAPVHVEAPYDVQLYQQPYGPAPCPRAPTPSTNPSATPMPPTAAATYDPPYAASASPHSSNYSPQTKSQFMSHDEHTVIDIPQYRVPGWGYTDAKQEPYDEEAYEYMGDDDSQDGGLQFADDDEEEANTTTQHFGPAPAKGAQLRRHKSRKHVPLTQGNLIIDCPIPTKLLGFLNNRTDSEFTTMRYTAVTCDPDEFMENSYTLRPRMYGRTTELFICLTIYNEDEVLFTRTLHGVMKNIAHLCSRNRSKTWGHHGWQKVVVCIVADGRRKINPRVLDCLAALGVYQDGVAKNTVNEHEVQAHVYEYTTQLSLDPNMRFKGAEKGLVPCQIILCIKERNQKKINSHRWFFNAFSQVLKPNICLLLDVGTRPEPKSIYHLWKSFDINSNVAGACGEICADVRGKWGVGPALLNPLVAAQNFEYKISNILDKTTESVFGSISVLPGAFSAYRYIALQNDEEGKGPLASYFKGETLLGAEADVFTSNMYLAEDRILCFELVAKKNESWVLKYVKSARGVTDVPTDLAELISQRRRWLNGSFFAALYSLVHTRQISSSAHTPARKAVLGIQAVYNLLNLFFSWFVLGNMACFFFILTQGLEAPDFHLPHIHILNTIVQYVYIGALVSCFIFAMGNRPQGSRWKYYTAAGIFAVLMTYMLIVAIVCFVHVLKGPHNSMYAQMIISILATYGVYVVSSLIALDPSYLLTSMLPYLLLSPTWSNILNVYAFCNLHDFSWGTKGEHTVSNDLGQAVVAGKGEKEVVELILPNGQADIDAAYDDALLKLRTRPVITKGPPTPEEQDLKRMDYYRNVRTNVVLAWVLSNVLLMAIILTGGRGATFDSHGRSLQRTYMVVILIWVACSSLVRFIGSTIYMTIRLLGG